MKVIANNFFNFTERSILSQPGTRALKKGVIRYAFQGYSSLPTVSSRIVETPRGWIVKKDIFFMLWADQP